MTGRDRIVEFLQQNDVLEGWRTKEISEETGINERETLRVLSKLCRLGLAVSFRYSKDEDSGLRYRLTKSGHIYGHIPTGHFPKNFPFQHYLKRQAENPLKRYWNNVILRLKND